MARQRTAAEMREYQRQRREKGQRYPVEASRGDQVAWERQYGDRVHPVTGIRYSSDGQRLGDGLPDTNQLIEEMSQEARDRVLAQPSIRTPKQTRD